MRSWRSAVWNGALSLIIPGLGQVRARSWSLGVALLGVTAAVWVASRCVTWLRPEPAAVAVAAVLSLGYVLFALGSAVDAIRRTRRAIYAARPGWLRSTWLAFLVMLTIYAIAEFLLPLGWRAFNIPAGSMAPTLLVGDYLIVGEMPAGATPARGDVVIFKYPRDNTTNYVKRVIGLSGNRVLIRQGQLFINGQLCPRRPKDDFRDDSSDVVMVRRMYQETLPNGVSYDILKERDLGGRTLPVRIVRWNREALRICGRGRQEGDIPPLRSFIDNSEADLNVIRYGLPVRRVVQTETNV